MSDPPVRDFAHYQSLGRRRQRGTH